MKNKKLLIVLFFVFCGDAYAESLCVPKGVSVLFFNGMDNTQQEAEVAKKYIERAVRENKEYKYLDEKKFKFELLYNDTYGRINDILEFMTQRADEVGIDSYDLFVEIKTKNKKRLDEISGKYPFAGKVINELSLELNEKFFEYTIEMIDKNETENIYGRHKNSLESIIASDKRLVLIAHSQGNIFLNKAYDYASKNFKDGEIRVIHIAPAFMALKGEYVLSNNDKIINWFGDYYGEGTVPEENMDIPFNINDIFGHQLIETYLNKSFYSSQYILSSIRSHLFFLEPENSIYDKRDTGFFRVSINTPRANEIRIHVNEPENSNPENYYRNFETSESVGYYSSCNPNNVLGEYKIKYSNYSDVGGFTAKLVLSNYGGVVISTKDIYIEPYNKNTGEHPKIDIGSIFVENDKNGHLKAVLR